VSKRGVIAGAAVVAIAGGAVAVVALSGSSPASSSIDNTSPTQLVTVRRQSLSSQTQVSATLGYADTSTIAVPAGTAPASLQQAKQAADQAELSLQTARATLAADQRALDQARATLAADRRKLAVDCAGDNAAESGSAGGSGNNATAPACVTDAQAVTTDTQAVSAADDKVKADRWAVSAAQRALTDANAGLADAESSATSYGQTAVYTSLPKVGDIVRRGEPLYAIGGKPVLLLYGSKAAWRTFAPGMSPGADVAELNANLRALGYAAPTGNAFTATTERAIEELQAAHGMTAAGRLLLGAVAFAPGAVRVTSVTPTVGAPVQAGPELGITSTRRVVKIALDASQQASVKVGDAVTVTLPDNSTTTGRVSDVGTVATTPSSDQSGNSTPTIEVDVTLDHPAASGTLDQAPVNVSITTDTVRNVLVVPVNALLALASGGYAVEVSGAGGARRLVRVTTGLFDDAQGLVEVSGTGLLAGQRVVVPAS